jgi:hypothetical protein
VTAPILDAVAASPLIAPALESDSRGVHADSAGDSTRFVGRQSALASCSCQLSHHHRVRYYFPKFKLVPGWLVSSREVVNFTDDLTDYNRLLLADTISAVRAIAEAQIEGFLSEPARDTELLAHIAAATHASKRRTISDRVLDSVAA